ncbi:hypothetical protein EBX31_13265, partial [bacterium]|nr:hypothetical protein [bacterium]
MNKKKWLLYVEDPGAVNFFAPLVQALRHQKIAHEICACGHAVKLLKKRDIAPRRYRRSRSHGLVKNSSL